MNSVEQEAKSNILVPQNKQNEMAATEVQTPDLEALDQMHYIQIAQTYQELYTEVNMMKATQLEDSDKLMQALETLRNFEGNNLQISERLN